MVNPAAGFDLLCVALQQIQDQWAQVAADQQGVVLLQEEMGQTLQDALAVLLAPYLRINIDGQVLGVNISPGTSAPQMVKCTL